MNEIPDFEDAVASFRRFLVDRVSTGSGSDLVQLSQSKILSKITCRSLTRSLPLPVLTRSNNDSDF